jgi:N-ethylmaleimide reductase
MGQRLINFKEYFMSAKHLLAPVELGAIHAANRIFMAPLTRMRAIQGDVPNPLAVDYYAQRASAGLIITEATQISPLGKGYPGTPGIYSSAQTAGWKAIVNAVHAQKGKIVAQLWHVGRISHSSLHPEEGLPVAPSAIAPEGKVFTASWAQEPYETPRAMTQADIDELLMQFKQAAENAKAAGFDGVEVHAANGYLLDQFLQDQTNQRTDQYGGSIDNRARLLMQVLDTVCTVFPADRVGVRLSPYGTFNSMADSDPIGLFTAVIQKLNARSLAYLHLIEPRATTAGGSDANDANAPCTSALFKPHFKGALISAGGYDLAGGEEAIAQGRADAIAYGRLFISNPDLPKRFELGAALNAYDRNTFYGGDAKGYTDYPALG